MSTHSIEPYDAFGMYSLAHSIANDDWTLQDDAIALNIWSGGKPSYFANSLELLKSIDFNNVDIITIAYGTNDFWSKKTIEDATDRYSVDSFNGALRYSIEAISEAYPNVKIVLCTPIYRFWMDSNGDFLYDSDELEREGNKILDFVQAVKDVANEYGLLCIDNYVGSGIGKENRTECFSGTDGTHPNEAGRQRIAENMAKELYEAFGK